MVFVRVNLQSDAHLLLDALEDVGVDVVRQVDVGDGRPQLLDLGQSLLEVVVLGKVLDHESVYVPLADGRSVHYLISCCNFNLVLSGAI